MISSPPVPFRRKRETNKPVVPVSSPLAEARVVAVLARGAQAATWFFSVPVLAVGDMPQLIIDTDAGPQVPVDIGVLSDYALTLAYGAGDIESGLAWHMDTTAGLAFGGVPVVVPQSGTTIE